MAKPTNLGTYNQNIEFADENVFQKAFDEGRERQQNIIEEAYNKKKDEFIDDFYTNLRYKIEKIINSPLRRYFWLYSSNKFFNFIIFRRLVIKSSNFFQKI